MAFKFNDSEIGVGFLFVVYLIENISVPRVSCGLRSLEKRRGMQDQVL
jgi:hypothetical protein